MFRLFTVLLTFSESLATKYLFLNYEPVSLDLFFLNTNSIIQHVIRIKSGITIHINVNVKIVAHAKKIIVGILANVFVRIASI